MNHLNLEEFERKIAYTFSDKNLLILALAKEYGVKSIAFPSISTGVYRFPIDLAAKIAVGEILHFLETDDTMEQIILVCFDEGTKAAYQKAFAELTA